MENEETVQNGLIIDNFAGGGGASTGIELALGRYVDYAINHDPDSIAMHQANHPHTIHLCEDVFKVNPVKLCAGRPVLLAWFSPDCKHFSKAKGGKPADKHIRGLAWVTVKWAKTVKPKVILLENVEEFQTWGPLGDDCRPIEEKKGTTFHKFISELRNLGYEVDYRELVAADYGAPTKRKRFFIIARCDGRPIRWPEKEYAPRGKCAKGQKPWRSAADIIDFSLPTKSIFNRPKELAEPTKRRIGRGLEKFVLRSAAPFIIPIGYGENKNQAPRLQDIRDPLNTIVSSNKHNVVQPLLSPYMGVNNFEDPGRDIRSPLATVTTNNKEVLIAPVITDYKFANTGSKATDPLPTETTVRSHYVTSSYLSEYYGHGNPDPIDKPLGTVTTKDRFAKVDVEMRESGFIQEYYGGTYKGNGANPSDPLPTVTTLPRFWLVKIRLEKDSSKLGNWPLVRDFINKYTTVRVSEDEILLITVEGHDYFISDIAMRMLTPRELYDAQGFPHDYIIDRDANGKDYPASKQVARCGNAVPPPFAEALVRANLTDLCPKSKIETMKLLKVAQIRFMKNRQPFNGMTADGQTSLFSDFEAITKQVAEEAKGRKST